MQGRLQKSTRAGVSVQSCSESLRGSLACLIVKERGRVKTEFHMREKGGHALDTAMTETYSNSAGRRFDISGIYSCCSAEEKCEL